MAIKITGWDIALVSMGVILICGVLPAMGCFCFQYTKNLDHIVLKKRYSRVVYWEIILFLIKLLFSASVFICMMIESDDKIASTPVTISMIGANVFAYCLYLTWVWRFYLLGYDINWIIAAKNDHWQNIINPTYKDSVASWFIKNRKKYGNIRWTFCHLFMPLLFIGILLQNLGRFLILSGVDDKGMIHYIFRIMDYCIGLIPFVLMILVYCTIPSFQDKFYIHQELKNILIAISVQYLGFLGTILFILILPDSLFWIITYFVSILCEFIAMGFATIWVAKKVESIIHSQLYHIRQFESKSKNNEYVSIDSPKHNLSHNNIGGIQAVSPSKKLPTMDKYTLDQILQNDQSFSLFMINLSHEFSQEILLSFVEMIQYQQLISQYINIHNLTFDQYELETNRSDYGYSYVSREYYEFIHFPDNVPKSSIIYGAYKTNSHSLIEDIDIHCHQHEFVEKLKVMVCKIFEKYISSDAQFQINVPFTTQRSLQKALQDEKSWINNNSIQLPKYLHIFDDCIFDVYSLMIDSFARFKKTQRYLTLQLRVDT